MEDISKCLITGLPIKSYKKCEEKNHGHNPFLQYKVDINSKEYFFGFCLNCLNETIKFIEANKKLLFALLLNGKEIPKEEDSQSIFEKHTYLLHKQDLEKFIKNNSVLTSPSDKLDNLFLSLSSLPKYEGEKVSINNDINKEEFYLKYYFKNKEELVFYINTLNTSKLLEFEFINDTPVAFKVTYDGLLKSISMQEEGIYGNRCFVAMSFDSDDEFIFNEVIEPVCEMYNFKAIRVDRLHPGTEQTINDLIIAELKKAKFIIADFTKNKSGVYFEAGYALGKSKQVIYTCSKEHFQNLHFDVNHFPVLIYETKEQLKEMLKNKIEAYIL
ncbi:MAG: hypothetical protein JWN83_2594 [Chitinophagaceae bacterium]|nr:hypothetical protein [Chitinophagaceae bacterium]